MDQPQIPVQRCWEGALNPLRYECFYLSLVPHLVGECMVPWWACEGEAGPAMRQSRVHRIHPRPRRDHTHLRTPSTGG